LSIRRPRKKYKRVEREYVVDYVVNHFPQRVRAYFNLRLGPAPEWVRKAYPNVKPGYFKVWKRYADAVVVTQTAIYLVEAKVHNVKVGPGYLLEYRNLLPQTPELKPYLGRPIHLRLVIPIPDPWVMQTCDQLGIEVDVYQPEWLIPILKEKGYI